MKYIETKSENIYYNPIYWGVNILYDYISLHKLSIYKNLFNIDVTICPKRTIDDINIYLYKKIKYEYNDNSLIILNRYINDNLEKYFIFYGWKKQEDNITLLPMYDIINPDKWINEHTDEGKNETMYFNNYNIDNRELISRVRQQSLSINDNIFYDYCFNENNTKFKDLFNKNISIDPISTINQIKDFYDDIILNYDKENNIINIKRKQLNKWNTVLIMLFKFYGWYPKDNISVYPKFEIFKL